MNRSRSGLTLIEVMSAVAIGTFVAAIGFTGVTAFGRSITRAKQFTSETEMITALIRQTIARADQGHSDITDTPGDLPTPPTWTRCVMEPNAAKFYMQLKVTTTGSTETTASTTGDVRKALQMTTDGTGSYNTLQLKTITCYPVP